MGLLLLKSPKLVIFQNEGTQRCLRVSFDYLTNLESESTATGELSSVSQILTDSLRMTIVGSYQTLVDISAKRRILSTLTAIANV